MKVIIDKRFNKQSGWLWCRHHPTCCTRGWQRHSRSSWVWEGNILPHFHTKLEMFLYCWFRIVHYYHLYVFNICLFLVRLLQTWTYIYVYTYIQNICPSLQGQSGWHWTCCWTADNPACRGSGSWRTTGIRDLWRDLGGPERYTEDKPNIHKNISNNYLVWSLKAYWGLPVKVEASGIHTQVCCFWHLRVQNCFRNVAMEHFHVCVLQKECK